MSKQLIRSKKGMKLAIICPQCGRGMEEHGDEATAVCPYPQEFASPRSVTLVSIEKTETGFRLVGNANRFDCAFCGLAMRAISAAVPLELDGLVCMCGSTDFRPVIQSLRPAVGKEAEKQWEFELDVFCTRCSHISFRERIFNLLKLKRIKVGATGIECEMK
jgi:hypothetical protein